MPRWVLLLRGVNVGGHGKLPMAALRDLLTQNGASAVQTYIQSGNVVMDHPEPDAAALCNNIAGQIAAQFGFRPAVLALSLPDLSNIVAEAPFVEQADPKNLWFHIFADAPADDTLARLTPDCTSDEVLSLKGRCLIVHAPKGIGKSKLPARIERAAGSVCTARNLNSLRAVMALAHS
ncbi:DUF1697 domain-containing protein [Thalassovita taeanensis]|uniref:Uncharacterized conserved protein, DUF1697 family n=1 Tax=Thalassovita taeanensis TaxID=657014 RepID=A0A1H8YXW3_9RHOB|nr:DUF1697 domain-containing protein [Thalassovita taeanensis]SEP57075.1 Uncharacterized conserved protein, DUF1697 family [Thalassovita taeanensis]